MKPLGAFRYDPLLASLRTDGGHDVTIEPIQAKRLLAYVPDDPKLFDALTAALNLQWIHAETEPIAVAGPSPQPRTVSSTRSVAGSRAPGIDTASTSTNCR